MSQNSGLLPLISLISLIQVRRRKKRSSRNQGMETITSHTCLWVVRKNLTSIMKVLLVGFCGL